MDSFLVIVYFLLAVNYTIFVVVLVSETKQVGMYNFKLKKFIRNILINAIPFYVLCIVIRYVLDEILTKENECYCEGLELEALQVCKYCGRTAITPKPDEVTDD